MKLSDFKFNLPKEQIAEFPLEKRDEAKMMVLNRDKHTIENKIFKDVVGYFKSGDVLVLNDTKVFPARLFGYKEKTDAQIEVFLLRELDHKNKLWDVVVDPARKVRIGNKIYFPENLVAEVIDNTTSRGRTIRFLHEGDDIFDIIMRIGHTPLPPYIKREAVAADKEDYQTVFAKNIGAVAAPTAGLHFTPEILETLKAKGVHIVYLTLHIGLGTFRPVEVEDLTKHRMDSEYYRIPEETAIAVNKAVEAGKKIVACGTTAVRCLESSVTADKKLKPSEGWTDKFIFPPYEFKIVDHLITNFHMPESTLVMLAAAFAEPEFTTKAYKKAIKDNYRFLSYGDCMLIL
ncbi:MAG: tRNA preQ1(34) S-adenosylmethionine ribosyltransferase-isomerase QueA [Bacteroidetes bacterium]|nr:tRNA preQ1(34) S-adenosylmethionine ribosyltransferase-isomerase QueA [Bacteroidota bacterium]